MGSVAILSTEVFVAIIFAIINLRIQINFMAKWWAKGCSGSQFLDIYDLREKYNKWMITDIIVDSLLMLGICSVGFLGGWFPYVLGIVGIEAIAAVCMPFRFVGAKYAVNHNPNLLDFNGKYKATHQEYMKLTMLLDEKKLKTYTNSASRLWTELLLLNKRRKEAYAAYDRLEEIKSDVLKLILKTRKISKNNPIILPS